MSSGLLVVVGLLAVLAIILLVCKVVKAAAAVGLVVAVIYVGHQYVLPFWEEHLAPLVSSFF